MEELKGAGRYPKMYPKGLPTRAFELHGRAHLASAVTVNCYSSNRTPCLVLISHSVALWKVTTFPRDRSKREHNGLPVLGILELAAVPVHEVAKPIKPFHLRTTCSWRHGKKTFLMIMAPWMARAIFMHIPLMINNLYPQYH